MTGRLRTDLRSIHADTHLASAGTQRAGAGILDKLNRIPDVYNIPDILSGISFLLGIILGAIMEYGHCVYICMLLHFVFRFAFWDSQVLIAMLAWSGGTFFVNPLIWLAICCAYLVVLYFTYFRKKEYGSYV